MIIIITFVAYNYHSARLLLLLLISTVLVLIINYYYRRYYQLSSPLPFIRLCHRVIIADTIIVIARQVRVTDSYVIFV